MSRKLLKIIVIVAIGLIFILSLWYFLSISHNKTPDSPNFQLSPTEQLQVQSIVENFVPLYNSYSYKNYDDIRSLYDSQSPPMQAKIDAYVAHLDAVTPIGFKRNTEILSNTFSYNVKDSTTLETQVRAKVTEINNNQQVTYTAIASVELVKGYDAWSVNDINIIKQ